MYFRVKHRARFYLLKIPGPIVKGKRVTFKEQNGWVKKGIIVEEISVPGAILYDWPLVKTMGGRRGYISPGNLIEISPLEVLARA